MPSYINQNKNYYRNQRKSLAEYVPGGKHFILDVGCGSGFFGEYLKKSGKAEKVYGIELLAEVAAEATGKIDAVLCADLDTHNLSNLDDLWREVAFDYIVCADVLEHLQNPEMVLRALKRYLKPSGKLIVSVPNVRNWSVVAPLLFKGRWDYQDSGIMDRTHLRFFTKSTAIELISNCGYQIKQCDALFGKRRRILSNITLSLFDEFLSNQYVYVAVPSN